MKHTILAFIFLFINTTLNAQTSDNLITIGKKYSLYSKILKETRSYSVYLPPSYQSNPAKKYFVAYVFDGGRNKFLEVTGIAQSMNSRPDLKMQIPELIIV